MQVLGLTGGIASGKSTVVRWFKEKGIPVLDADEIVRNLQRPHEPLLQDIASLFGSHLLLEDGSLNRGELGKLIFTDEAAKEKLNGLIHPMVKSQIQKGIEAFRQAGKSLVVVDVPLLYETGFEALMDKVLVVYVPKSVQVQRLMERDAIDESYAKSKIASQGSLDEKKAKADFVLENSGTKDELKKQFDLWFDHFQQQ